MTIQQFNSFGQHKKENAILEFGKISSHFTNNNWVFDIYEINEADTFYVILASPDNKNEKIITTGYSFLDEIFLDFGMYKDQSGNWILKPQLLPSWVMEIQDSTTSSQINKI